MRGKDRLRILFAMHPPYCFLTDFETVCQLLVDNQDLTLISITDIDQDMTLISYGIDRATSCILPIIVKYSSPLNSPADDMI
jgi:hypothetical protein